MDAMDLVLSRLFFISCSLQLHHELYRRLEICARFGLGRAIMRGGALDAQRL